MRIVGVALGVCLAGCGSSASISPSGHGQADADAVDAWVVVTADASPADVAIEATDSPFQSGLLDASCVGADGGVDAAAPDGSVWANDLGCLVLAPAGPAPAPVSCDMDASADSGVCPLPPSVCADPLWLVYYDNGTCVAGSCVWQKRLLSCNGRGCLQGACGLYSTTAQ